MKAKPKAVDQMFYLIRIKSAQVHQLSRLDAKQGIGRLIELDVIKKLYGA
jgi:hypothetical protein